MKERKILLSHEFGDNIFTRSSITNFFDLIESLKEKNITLDFKDVEFISRSCADEYLKKKMISKKSIIEVNMSNEICTMINTVKEEYSKKGFKNNVLIKNCTI